MKQRPAPSKRFVLPVVLFLLASIAPIFSSQAWGAELAYFGHSKGDAYLVATAERGNERRILGQDYSYMYYNTQQLALSANGRDVAYCKYFLNPYPESHWEQWLEVEDVNLTKTIFSTTEGQCSSLDFSPDGNHLLYSKGEGESGLDIWELSLDESEEPHELVNWPNDQLYAHYAPDGEHIVFASDGDAEGELFGEEWNLFKTNLAGEKAVDLTRSSSLWTEDGADYGLDSDIRVNNETIVFECGYGKSGTTWHLCRINMDGTGAMDLGLTGGHEPSWNPNGSSFVYSTGSFPEKAIEVDPTGENPTVLPFEEIDGKKYSPSTTAVTRQSNRTTDNIARNFRPALQLDESERWRPLELNDMLGEEGVRLCVEGNCETSAWSLEELAELGEYLSPKAKDNVLDFPSSEGDWGYESPHFSDPSEYGAYDCTSGEVGVDCEDQEHDAIYYDASHISPGGYRFLEYWFFYRFNDSPIDEVPFVADNFDHEADWETVSVGVPNELFPKTFDFVVFAQHEGTWAYMRENLSCEEKESCEGDSKHVDVFPADGTHASYAGECEATLEVIPCLQQNEIFPENDHGGEVDWIGNHDAGMTRPLPPTYEGNWLEGPMGFTDWPGKWGENEDLEGSVSSPGNQGKYDEPWVADCSTDPCEREEEGQLRGAMRQSSPGSEATSDKAVARQCNSWFGVGVSAVLCSPTRLANTLDNAAMDQRQGSANLGLISGHRERIAPATGGLAQLGGQPLRLGDTLLISGNVGKGAVLLVRATNGRAMTRATYSANSAGGIPRSILVERGRDKKGVVALPVARTRTRQRVVPSFLRARVVKHSRREASR